MQYVKVIETHFGENENLKNEKNKEKLLFIWSNTYLF